MFWHPLDMSWCSPVSQNPVSIEQQSCMSNNTYNVALGYKVSLDTLLVANNVKNTPYQPMQLDK